MYAPTGCALNGLRSNDVPSLDEVKAVRCVASRRTDESVIHKNYEICEPTVVMRYGRLFA